MRKKKKRKHLDRFTGKRVEWRSVGGTHVHYGTVVAQVTTLTVLRHNGETVEVDSRAVLLV